MKYISIFVAIVSLICCQLTKADDSIPARELNEITVVGDRGWFEDGILNIIPSKSEKKLSNSPSTLVDAMNIPFLKSKDGSIVNMAGEEVKIFINGQEAKEVDIDTFWPKEVKKVQYLENPSDPTYKGAKAAVNFVMTTYVAGGVTKIDLYHKTPVNGADRASSKLVYKKMTYGLLLSGDYYRNHAGATTGETTYRDIYYNGIGYETITRKEDSQSSVADEGISCTFNANYTSDKTILTHTASFRWNKSPGNDTEGSDLWAPDIFKSSSSKTGSSSRSISPQISGDYYFMLNDKWNISTDWYYSYTRNHAGSFNMLGMTDPVVNNNVEDVNSFHLSFYPSFRMSGKWSFMFKLDADLDWFSTDYSGSAVTRQSQSRQSGESSLKASWYPIKSLSIGIEPGIRASYWQIGEIRQSNINPTANININWNPTSRSMIYSSIRFYSYPVEAGESNPVLLKCSELLWTLGNPYLKNPTSVETRLYASWLPKNFLSLGLSVMNARFNNEISYRYAPASAEMGGLVMETFNGDPGNHFKASLDLGAYLLSNRLSVQMTPSWNHVYSDNSQHSELNYFSIWGRAYYTSGNFRFGIWYEGSSKSLGQSGMQRSWKQDSWNAEIVYGTGNLYLSMRLEDMFHDKHRRWTRYDSPNFVSFSNRMESGRMLSLDIAYTFGYGKKVDSSINISGPRTSKTSVMSKAE